MSDYLDLLAFARGAEMANTANWKDVSNDIATRKAEDELSRSQAEFGLAYPLAEMRITDKVDDITSRRATSELTAKISQESLALPAKDRGAFIADRLQQEMQNIGNSGAGVGALQYLRRFAETEAGRYAAAGDLNTARILAQINGTGQQYAPRPADPSTLLTPKALSDPAEFARIFPEATANPDGKTVTIGGQTLPLATAAQVAVMSRRGGMNIINGATFAQTEADKYAEAQRRNQLTADVVVNPTRLSQVTGAIYDPDRGTYSYYGQNNLTAADVSSAYVTGRPNSGVSVANTMGTLTGVGNVRSNAQARIEIYNQTGTPYTVDATGQPQALIPDYEVALRAQQMGIPGIVLPPGMVRPPVAGGTTPPTGGTTPPTGGTTPPVIPPVTPPPAAPVTYGAPTNPREQAAFQGAQLGANEEDARRRAGNSARAIGLPPADVLAAQNEAAARWRVNRGLSPVSSLTPDGMGGVLNSNLYNIAMNPTASQFGFTPNPFESTPWTLG